MSQKSDIDLLGASLADALHAFLTYACLTARSKPPTQETIAPLQAIDKSRRELCDKLGIESEDINDPHGLLIPIHQPAETKP